MRARSSDINRGACIIDISIGLQPRVCIPVVGLAKPGRNHGTKERMDVLCMIEKLRRALQHHISGSPPGNTPWVSLKKNKKTFVIGGCTRVQVPACVIRGGFEFFLQLP